VVPGAEDLDLKQIQEIYITNHLQGAELSSRSQQSLS